MNHRFGIPEFHWDDANRNHLRRNDGSPEKAEKAFLDPDGALMEIQTGVGEERFRVLRMTADGRLLAVVFTHRGDWSA